FGRQRRAEHIVRLEIADRLPERSQQVGGHLQTGFARDPAVRVTQLFKFVAADFCRGQLFLQADFAGLVARAKLMSRFAIGADDHLGAQRAAEFPFPHFKRAGGGEFVIIEVRVDGEDFHAMRPPSNHAPSKVASRFCRGTDQNYLLNKCRLSFTVAMAIPAQSRFARSTRFFAWERNETPNDQPMTGRQAELRSTRGPRASTLTINSRQP